MERDATRGWRFLLLLGFGASPNHFPPCGFSRAVAVSPVATGDGMKLEPHKSQPVLYRAIGGDEYAAIITDVRDGREMSLATFMPMGGVTNVNRIKYFHRKADAADHKGPACYPAI
jgi:hypothetical protein